MEFRGRERERKGKTESWRVTQIPPAVEEGRSWIFDSFHVRLVEWYQRMQEKLMRLGALECHVNTFLKASADGSGIWGQELNTYHLMHYNKFRSDRLRKPLPYRKCLNENWKRFFFVLATFKKKRSWFGPPPFFRLLKTGHPKPWKKSHGKRNLFRGKLSRIG